MATLSKRQKAMQGKVDRNKIYAVGDALTLAKEFANRQVRRIDRRCGKPRH